MHNLACIELRQKWVLDGQQIRTNEVGCNIPKTPRVDGLILLNESKSYNGFEQQN